MKGPDQDEEAIFSAAKQLTDSRELKAYLDAACAGKKPELRHRVERLLGVSAQADEFFEGHAAAAAEAKTIVLTPVTEGPGTIIGRYKLLQQIGEGGMGVVYMAEQQGPVIRKVALKIIKLGMDTKEVIARFEAERQALALMDHPNIAKVFDAGATDSGRPYFVMELVQGIPITRFCDEAKLDTRHRLELFSQVCSAIQHAHQKAVIHRDIKPSNVLVTLIADQPVPKVIDFGIAKSTQQRLTEKTLFTQFQQFVGTPAYMSPEQASLSGLDVDTRSDIYALGVLLYELLTGKTPFDPKSLLSAGYEEMRRIIREVEPPKPSTRLSTMQGQELATTAKQRQADPKKLGLLIRGDLDWIVMKALEKDRTRRYGGASNFATDIRRYLAQEPVSAVPPSFGYRFRKFVRRNKTTLSVTVVLVVLSGALAVSVFLLLNELRAAKFGGITLNSNPQGAAVWHEGKWIGTTPLKMTNIPTGEFTYSLALVNYESVTNTTTMVPKRQVNDFTFLRKAELSVTNAVAAGNTNIQEFAATAPEGATLLTLQGKVEVARKGASGWIPAHPNMPLNVGDRVQTGMKSRAVLRLSNLSVLRVNQLTSLEIQSPGSNRLETPTLHLKNGQLDMDSRDRRDGTSNSPGINVITPAAKGSIKG